MLGVNPKRPAASAKERILRQGDSIRTDTEILKSCISVMTSNIKRFNINAESVASMSNVVGKFERELLTYIETHDISKMDNEPAALDVRVKSFIKSKEFAAYCTNSYPIGTFEGFDMVADMVLSTALESQEEAERLPRILWRKLLLANSNLTEFLPAIVYRKPALIIRRLIEVAHVNVNA